MCTLLLELEDTNRSMFIEVVAVEQWEGEDNAKDDAPVGWGKPSMSMKELYASGEVVVPDDPRWVLVLAVAPRVPRWN